MQQKRIAIFASGAGTNAQNLINYFNNHFNIQVKLIACNKQGAGALEVAKKSGIDTLFIEKEKFFADGYTNEIKKAGIDFIVLAGFLLKVPQALIDSFSHRIINIHPALLPKYGGKGMYGSKVHEAVIAAGDKESGITIHYVDEHFDHGDIFFQAKCSVSPGDTANSLAEKIHELEYRYFPKIVEECVLKTATDYDI